MEAPDPTKTPLNDQDSTATGPKPRKRRDRAGRARARAIENARGLVQDNAEAITKRAIELALQDSRPSTALLVALLRAIVPPSKEGSQVSNFKLPAPTSAAEAAAQVAQVVAAVANGMLDADVGRVALQGLQSFIGAASTVDLEARIAELEKRDADRERSKAHLRTIR